MYTVTPVPNGVCAPQGFYAGAVAAGLKPDGALDTAFVHADTLCDIAAIFTTNRFQAAPLRHFQKHAVTRTNFILINAKNANAMTGAAGLADVEEILAHAAVCHPQIENPVMSSTGVIGVRLPKEKIKAAIKRFDLRARRPDEAARAIMTTDRYPKQVAFEVTLNGGESFRIGAMAKGAGMIDPAMATMLCFITTDAAVPADAMRKILQDTAKSTFNAVSVDGDTSTNDTVMLLANGRSGVYDTDAFADALHRVMHELALMIVADGEGASKCVAFEVTGAADNEEAERCAKALSDSLLVKTALHGEDPNWGRIASTIGASGVACDPETLTITFGDVTVYERGTIRFDEANETKAAAVMKKEAFAIRCDLGQGEGAFTAYGCDLGHEYVTINADYRT